MFIASLRVVQADAKKALIKEAMDVLVAINADKDREKAAKNPLDPGIGIWLRYSKKVRAGKRGQAGRRLSGRGLSGALAPTEFCP